MSEQIYNPYLPLYEYVPDGEPHVFGDRVYIYGSHDRANGKVYCENDYVCYSAPVTDLKNWRYEGVIYRKTQDPNKKMIMMRQLWAPDVCRGCDGRYYLYYCTAFGNFVGVAVADAPQGPYEYYGRVHYPDGHVLGTGKGERIPFDPAVLCENGKVYLYSDYSAVDESMVKMLKNTMHKKIEMTGGRVFTLDSDMLTIQEEKAFLPGVKNSEGTGFEGHEFYEASSIRHFGDKYYFVYSSSLSHELAYAMSDYPDRDFHYCGTLISNGDIGYHGAKQEDAVNYWGNNHGGIEYINGEYYIFYHRQTNGGEFSRQGCAEKLVMNEDQTFDQAQITSCGLNGGPLEAKGRIPAAIACILKSAEGAIKTTDIGKKKKTIHLYITQDEPDGDGGRPYIANLRNGAKAGYRYLAIPKGTKLAVSSKGSAGTLLISSGIDGAAIAKINLSEHKDFAVSEAVTLPPEGTAELVLTYQGTGSICLNELIFS